MWPGMTEIARMTQRSEGEVLKGLLESEGFAPVLAADDAGGTNPELDLTRFVRILVPDADVARAREVIAAAREVGRDLPEDQPPPT